jgi:hypothetical protein
MSDYIFLLIKGQIKDLQKKYLNFSVNNTKGHGKGSVMSKNDRFQNEASKEEKKLVLWDVCLCVCVRACVRVCVCLSEKV